MFVRLKIELVPVDCLSNIKFITSYEQINNCIIHLFSAVSLKMTLQRSFTQLKNNLKLVSEFVYFEGTFFLYFFKSYQEQPIGTYVFEEFPLVPPLQNLRKCAI